MKDLKSLYCVQKVKNTEKYLVYLVKDLNIVYSSLSPVLLESVKAKTIKINQDKKKTMKQKLVDYFQEITSFDNDLDLYCLANIVAEIEVYFMERDMLAPIRSLSYRYAKHIQFTLLGRQTYLTLYRYNDEFVKNVKTQSHNIQKYNELKKNSLNISQIQSR